MVQVVEAGSGFAARIPGVQVAGKTGTAETGPGQNPHAWFVCFAPADHPRVAVVVMVEHGGEGAFVAAPLAKQILQAALSVVH
jgi:peptidoglycan glycosyltransferase